MLALAVSTPSPARVRDSKPSRCARPVDGAVPISSTSVPRAFRGTRGARHPRLAGPSSAPTDGPRHRRVAAGEGLTPTISRSRPARDPHGRGAAVTGSLAAGAAERSTSADGGRSAPPAVLDPVATTARAVPRSRGAARHPGWRTASTPCASCATSTARSISSRPAGSERNGDDVEVVICKRNDHRHREQKTFQALGAIGRGGVRRPLGGAGERGYATENDAPRNRL